MVIESYGTIDDVTQILPPRTRQFVLSLFNREWLGNLKDDIRHLTKPELAELANLYPEIWGEYVREFNERGPQSQQPVITKELRPNIRIEGRFRKEPFGQETDWSNHCRGGDR